MLPSQLAYYAPRTVAEAIALLRTHGEEAKLLAGGHSLLPILKQRLSNLRHLIDLGRIEGLSTIRRKDEQLCIGAMTTHTALVESALLADQQPLLRQAAATIGDVQIRNRGTIGGSLAHADPAADLIPVMLVLEAQMVIAGPSGIRTVSAADFFESMYTTTIENDEVLVEIRVPVAAENSRCTYEKVSHRASHLAVVGVAAQVCVSKHEVCESVRLALTGLAPIAYRALAAEESIRGRALTPECIDEAAARVTEGIDPLSDHYAPADYRAHLARIHTARALTRLAAP
jgi:carbon-monoxide dehydrogenase medium subunit